MATNTVEKAQEIYQIKVTLLGTDPAIWRRVLVPADLTLEQLHDVLQLAMVGRTAICMSSVSDSKGSGSPIRWSRPLVGRAQLANEPHNCSTCWEGREQKPFTHMISVTAGNIKS
jgi:hypothetical protein